MKYSKLSLICGRIIRFAANPWSSCMSHHFSEHPYTVFSLPCDKNFNLKWWKVFYPERTKTADRLFCAKINFKNYVTMCTHTHILCLICKIKKLSNLLLLWINIFQNLCPFWLFSGLSAVAAPPNSADKREFTI